MARLSISADHLAAENAKLKSFVQSDCDHLQEQVGRRGIELEDVYRRLSQLSLALPSWGVGTGGTRFARFPGQGEPRHVHDKLQDCAVVQQLVRCTPRVSLHLPWDTCADYAGLREEAEALGLGFDAVNSNTFQDQPGQKHSYQYGSLTHVDAAVREQAVAHNIECIRIGEQLGSKALTVWVGDGSNFPGQQNFRKAFERYIDSASKIYRALGDDWQMMLEHKLYEPAFYSTVIQDWGSSFMAASRLGPKARCLVDLGHHAPNVNIEMIVTRLASAGKLGGFHFNDSKYGDDDLDTGSINPYQLFLVFNELVDAQAQEGAAFRPAYMLDQSHNVTDPIESLMLSAIAVQRAYAQSLLVDRKALEQAQEANDAIAATKAMKQAFETDVTPLLQRLRLESGGAIDPVSVYRGQEYRRRVAEERPAVLSRGGGIV